MAKPPTPPKLPVHVFQGTGETDRHPLNPQEMCRCGSPEGHRVHQLPETPPEVRAEELRRLGETSD